MSDSNRIRVSIVEETGGYGVTPASPAFVVLPTTGQSIRDRVGYAQSNTISNDRNVLDLIRLSKAAGGGLPCELTYSAPGEALFQAIRAIMCVSAETAVTTEVTGVTSSANVLSAGSGNVETGVEIGDVLRIRNASDVLVAFVKVTAINTGAHTVTVNGDLPDVVTSYKVLRGARMKNGTHERSFTVEMARLDTGEERAQIFRGCVFGGMDFQIADEAITTVGFAISAQGSTFQEGFVSGSAFITGATYTDPAINPVLDALGVPELRRGGLDYAAKSIGMSVTNNVAPRTQIGALGPQSQRFGQFGGSGRIRAYMDGYSDLQDYADNEASDVWLVMTDPSGKGWSMSYPQTKFSDAGADTSGPNQDDYKELAVTAYKDPVELCTLRLQRWA